MIELTEQTAPDYVRSQGLAPANTPIHVRALGWGVSNIVLRVDPEGANSFVLKQSQERLRVAVEWLSRRERIWIERDALRLLANRLHDGAVPRVIHDDPENFTFGMTAAPISARVWKEDLLAGSLVEDFTTQCAALLARMHSISEPEVLAPFRDLSVFDELRLDPYYRTIRHAHPEITHVLDPLIHNCLAFPEADQRFVHADFSPKNILVDGHRAIVLDFETAHAGDPAFDIGFFTAHLILKAFRTPTRMSDFMTLLHAFVRRYQDECADCPPSRLIRAISHATACCLARIDGKSPVEYLDESTRSRVRHWSLNALNMPPASWLDLTDKIARAANSEFAQP